MTHPLTYGNGCTLEDCHTNVFALAELDGLSYKKFSPEKSIYLTRNEDPVLQSFNRCVQADILCAWKRTCTNNQIEPDLQLGKELWIFWYGIEPSNLTCLISPELKVLQLQSDTSSYAKGISYEARVLLFKALHTLIERCLYSQNYILIGKWFVQAFDHFGNCNPEKSGHLSIQFSFFLHGESTVCANVDVKQHMPLCKLHSKYITYANQNNGITVLLAPYGLSAHFTGQFIRDTDQYSVKLIAEWRQFYVLNFPTDIRPDDKIASVVEVIIDGNAMYYPSCFVFVTGDVDEMIMKHSNDNLNKDELEIIPCNLKSKSAKLDLNHSVISSLSDIIFSQVHTDSITSKSCSDAVTWNMSEPYTCSAPCVCSKKGMVAPSANREHAKKVCTPTGPIFHHRDAYKSRQCLREFQDVLHEDSKVKAAPDITMIDSIKLEDSPLSSQIASNDASSICTPVSNMIPPTSIPPIISSPSQPVNHLPNNVVINEISEFKPVELVESKFSQDLLKRPKLPFTQIHDDGEVTYTDYLYDFRSLNHWEGEGMRKRPLELLSPKSIEDCKEEKILKQSLDDMKHEVHIKPSCNVPDKLFETESDNSDTEMLPIIPLSPMNVKSDPDLSEMYPTPPSMDHTLSPLPIVHNSPIVIEEYNGSIELYKALSNEIHVHNENFRIKLEKESVYCIPDRAATIDAECYTTIDIVKSNISTPVYTPKSTSSSLNCYSILPANEVTSVQPARTCPSPLLNFQTNDIKNGQRKYKNALSIIVTLSDTILSIYKDRNFDSSVICSCNNNIDGSDSGIYISRYDKEAQYKCHCGFSSVLNRTLGFNSGLFYEDEKMISGISYKQAIKAKLTESDYVPSAQENNTLLKLVIDQCTQLYDFNKYSNEFENDDIRRKIQKSNILQLKDASLLCYKALDMDDFPESPLVKRDNLRPCCLHPWIYRDLGSAVSTQDIFRLLKSLQPLLQEALQKKSSERLWEATYTITGPLSYKDFHLLSGRGSDETSEPQPIPPMIFGLDKQWITVAPQTISYWDKMMLEPVGRQRDIVYIALVPDSELILKSSRIFFKELSNTYELLRFGQHRPVNFDIRDSIIRIGSKDKFRPNEIIDSWFKNIGNSLIAEQLSLYAKVCQYTLTPVLLQILEDYDKLLKKQINKLPRPSGTTHVQNSQSEHCPEPVFIQHSQTSRFYNDPVLDVLRAQKSEIRDAPSYLIYMINPFSFSNLDSKDSRIAHIGLIKCFSLVLEGIPKRIHHKIHLQLVSLNTIMTYEKLRSNIRMLAISIYSKCRRLISHSILGQPVTSFGPAATLAQDAKHMNNLTRMDYQLLYCPPFSLSIDRNIDKAMVLDTLPNPNILLCIYCLSDDQNWLLVSCTDSTGQIMESQAISIAVDNRDRRKKASARKIGLQKLWDYVLSIISASVLPWRLVIGRFGRIGHSELIGWAGILSRTHIQETRKRLSSMCRLCQNLSHCVHEMPYIQSACLVSLEPHPSLRIITDSIKVEEKQSGISNLCTPKDSSVTHILVFPTSAIAQLSADNASDSSVLSNDIFKQLDEFENSELINSIGVDSPPLKSSRPSSPRMAGSNGDNSNSSHIIRPSVSSISAQEGDVNLLQQPLAMGFYISTAKTGCLPDWFWSNCPERQNLSPVCLKSSLHIHCASAQETDDYQYDTKTSSKHPLDSNTTCDVLRYVLEMYNALSWLTIDCQKNERNSCLPIHIVILMQMYHAFKKYV